MKTIHITITFEVSTNKNLEEIGIAIKKGLYYGLDIKHIASPRDIANIVIKQTNP